jgi:SAM-dependent methyltransferase
VRVHELSACTACGSEDSETFVLDGGHKLKKCRSCETVSALEYADPADVYTDGYMFGETDFGLDARHPEFQQYLMRVANRRLELIEGVTGGPGSILDVGSGTGEVLLAARERDWKVQGVEPERTGAQMAIDRGLPVEVAMLEDSGLPERSFDVVSAFHVVEHVPDVRGFLRTIARWARPGGHVVVEVPNFASLQGRRFRDLWIQNYLRPLEHLTHFTPETLERALRDSGLDPRVVRAPAYVGPPQALRFALGDLGRGDRVRKLLRPFTHTERRNGGEERVPGAAGWTVLRALDAIQDRLGLGMVVFSVSRVS